MSGVELSVSISPVTDTRLALSHVKTFTNPLITSTLSSPDPWVTYREGYYYFCRSYKNEIWVWKASTLTGLDQGRKVKVWTAPETGSSSKQIWAPELHFLNGRWYIYYAASDGKNVNHRMFVLESVGSDALGDYLAKGKITSPDDHWAIDGNVLCKEDGSLYFIWSGWPGRRNGVQNLYIAPMSNPWTIVGERVLLSTPTYPWEGWINEGPQILQRNGKIFMVYSANESWRADYCLALLTNSNGDVLNPAAWTKATAPLFTKSVSPKDGAYCVGHCSFTTSPDGSEDWILYHAKDNRTRGWIGRTTRAQKFSWKEDGTPDFGIPVPVNMPVALPSGEFAFQYELHNSRGQGKVLTGRWTVVIGAYAGNLLPQPATPRLFRIKLHRKTLRVIKPKPKVLKSRKTQQP